MSRLATIGDGTNTHAAYKYLGAGTIVEEDYADIDVKLTYLNAAGDNVTGLDRFGRIADQVWLDYAADPDAPIDRYTYAYDRAGNRTSKTNELNGALDEDYVYDDLDRLIEWKLNGSTQKTWSLDSLGNNLAAGTYNAANEETPTVGSSGYDAAGNMTTLQSGKTAVYDAWNRMVEVCDGATVVERNEYDGQNRRIQIFSDFTGATPGKIVDDYHTGQKTVETRENSAVVHQTVWSPRYIDAAILRDTYSGGQIVAAERVFYLADANYNVTGLVKYDSGASKWNVAERYTYTPYGVVAYRESDWDVVASSANANTTLYTGREFDLLTALYYYRARFYDAGLERFIGRDPIRYRGGMNMYRYVGNRPLNASDPTGLDETSRPTGFGGNASGYTLSGGITPPWKGDATNNWRQCMLDYYRRVMKAMIAVGDSANKCPSPNKTSPWLGNQNWSRLRDAMQYMLDNYSDVNNMGFTEGSSYNLPGIPGFTIDATMFGSGTQGNPFNAIRILIHEPQHDWTMSTFGIGHGGWGDYAMSDVVGPPEGPNYYDQFVDYLQNTRTSDGTSLWDAAKKQAGPCECG